MNIKEIARVCHEVNKAYCEANGDHSQPSWEEAPDWQKASAYNGVLLHLKHPWASPAMGHESWMYEKKQDGWKYGPVKDPEKKEHPCMVSFEDLPLEQKAKDYIFKAIVNALARH